MNDMLRYKGYVGSIHFDQEALTFYGKLEFIRAVVTYEANTAASLVQAFRDAVDDYLTTCEEQNLPPDEPFKGTLNVRIGKQLHRSIAMLAAQASLSTNAYIKHALESYVKQQKSYDSNNHSHLE